VGLHFGRFFAKSSGHPDRRWKTGLWRRNNFSRFASIFYDKKTYYSKFSKSNFKALAPKKVFAEESLPCNSGHVSLWKNSEIGRKTEQRFNVEFKVSKCKVVEL
jgi:hypothetical protein